MVPILAWAYSTGAPARSSGAPGEQSCSQTGCHVGTVNPDAERVAITFADGNTYTPGTAKTVNVTIPQAQRHGFQVSARLASDPQNAQAGSFPAPGTGMDVICLDGSAKFGGGRTSCRPEFAIEYLGHTNATTQRTYTFQWMPPASDAGNINFYVSGNAANGNGLPTGDRVYTSTAALTYSAGTGSRPTPIISGTDGVVNGATFSSLTGVASGSFLTVFGSNLAESTTNWNGSFQSNRAPTTLAGTRLLINDREAYIAYVSPTQINAVMPEDDALGTISVVAITPYGSSLPLTVQKKRYAPALFLYDPQNRRYAASLVADGSARVGRANLFGGPIDLPVRPARPGEYITLFGSGFGATSPAYTPGQIPSASPLPTKPTITIGGVTATGSFDYAGLNGFIGVYQFNVPIPANLPDGDHEVVITYQGETSQRGVYVTVGR